jgi:hypothetical protein
MSSPGPEWRKAKYDAQGAQEVKSWIENVINEKLPDGDPVEVLRDGIYICKLANVISPGIAQFKVSQMPFVQVRVIFMSTFMKLLGRLTKMENIAAFLRAATHIGVPHHELFETVDLYELSDPVQVIITLRSLSRHAHKTNPDIPVLGPKLVAPSTVERKSTRTGDIPAWNTRQYGYMRGARNIITRQQILAPAAPNIMLNASSTSKTAPTPPPKPSGLMTIRPNAKQTQTAKPSIFGDDEDEAENPLHGKNNTLISHKPNAHGSAPRMVEEEEHPSVYAYDEVYDSMKAAERQANRVDDTKKVWVFDNWKWCTNCSRNI